MPTSEAQKRANKKWRDNHKEEYIQSIYDWCKNNIDKKREYARRYATKKQVWIVASRELLRCLL
jgi:predicted transcriptional regulator YheO